VRGVAWQGRFGNQRRTTEGVVARPPVHEGQVPSIMPVAIGNRSIDGERRGACRGIAHRRGRADPELTRRGRARQHDHRTGIAPKQPRDPAQGSGARPTWFTGRRASGTRWTHSSASARWSCRSRVLFTRWFAARRTSLAAGVQRVASDSESVMVRSRHRLPTIRPSGMSGIAWAQVATTKVVRFCKTDLSGSITSG
jgi:hypothetical protein